MGVKKRWPLPSQWQAYMAGAGLSLIGSRCLLHIGAGWVSIMH